MNSISQIWSLLVKQLKPTTMQVLISGILALAVLLVVQSKGLLKLLGFDSPAYIEGGKALGSRLEIVLSSQLASNIVLVTFWATIGFITYLIVWSLLSILTDIRNEVTIETAYTNRGHWRGVWETIALKSLVLAILVGFMSTFQYTFSLWITLTTPVSTTALPQMLLQIVAASIGLSMQIYLIILLVVLLITPWYRPSAFTD